MCPRRSCLSPIPRIVPQGSACRANSISFCQFRDWIKLDVLRLIKPMSRGSCPKRSTIPDMFTWKHSGFRAVCYIENGECRRVSRNMRHLRFESLQKTLAKLAAKETALDGEVICL